MVLVGTLRVSTNRGCRAISHSIPSFAQILGCISRSAWHYHSSHWVPGETLLVFEIWAEQTTVLLPELLMLIGTFIGGCAIADHDISLDTVYLLANYDSGSSGFIISTQPQTFYGHKTFSSSLRS